MLCCFYPNRYEHCKSSVVEEKDDGIWEAPPTCLACSEKRQICGQRLKRRIFSQRLIHWPKPWASNAQKWRDDDDEIYEYKCGLCDETMFPVTEKSKIQEISIPCESSEYFYLLYSVAECFHLYHEVSHLLKPLFSDPCRRRLWNRS